MIDVNLLIAVGGIAITLIFSILTQNRASKNSVKDEIQQAKAEAQSQQASRLALYLKNKKGEI